MTPEELRGLKDRANQSDYTFDDAYLIRELIQEYNAVSHAKADNAELREALNDAAYELEQIAHEHPKGDSGFWGTVGAVEHALGDKPDPKAAAIRRAAPNLLAACEEFVAERPATWTSEMHSDANGEAWEVCTAAIAKARPATTPTAQSSD